MVLTRSQKANGITEEDKFAATTLIQLHKDNSILKKLKDDMINKDLKKERAKQEIIKQIDMKTESLVGFEIFLDNLKLPKKSLKDQKTKYSVSDYQKSERDFAFIVDKKINVQDLVNVISKLKKI